MASIRSVSRDHAARAAHPRDRRLAWAAAGITLALLALSIAQILRTAGSPDYPSAPFYVPTAFVALAVFVIVFGVAAFVRRFDLSTSPALAWVVGAVSLVLAIVPWAIRAFGDAATAQLLYNALHVAPSVEEFWDLSLVLRSVDCASWGFDVFVDNNGCLTDAAIYAPGMLWLQHVPFGIFAFEHVRVLGVLSIIVSSLALVWLARQSAGVGRVVLLIAAAGAPWLLLLERANVDAWIVWTAVVAVALVRRWNALWAWSLAAALIWLGGAFKYYPFALGLMLLPVLRLRRGWTVLAGFAAASAAYVLLTWDNFRFSLQSNTDMTEVSDFSVLGRVPVVARMIGSTFPAEGIQPGDLIVLALCVTAVAWGAFVARTIRGLRQHESMLAIAGSAVFLASVLVGGFGWSYKAVFLLPAVPLLAAIARGSRTRVFAGLSMLTLVAVASVVVWNTTLATLAGLIAASFAFGASATLIIRGVAQQTRRHPANAQVAALHQTV